MAGEAQPLRTQWAGTMVLAAVAAGIAVVAVASVGAWAGRSDQAR